MGEHKKVIHEIIESLSNKITDVLKLMENLKDKLLECENELEACKKDKEK